MSKGIVETIADFFKAQAPLWACELTAKHVVVAGVNSRRTRIAGHASAEFPKDAGGARSIVRQLLSEIGFKGTEIAVVVPDETARIAFLTAEKLSRNVEEQRTFIRWKLKKSVPFDVDTAQVAYRVLGPNRSGTGMDMLVALSPRNVVEEYEAMFHALDIHAGIVLPSTLAALNLFSPPAEDTLFLKVAPDSFTTTVFQKRRIQFYRRVNAVSLYDAVYPTLLYYQDKMGGTALEQLCVCGYDKELGPALNEIRQKLGLTAQHVGPKNLEDIYNPVLGAIHLRPEGVS